jgi:hypothetical protein
MQARIDRRAKKCIDTRVTRYIKGGRTMISLRFDPKLLKDLDALAESIGRNRSELLEEGARLVMAKHPSPKKPKPK